MDNSLHPFKMLSWNVRDLNNLAR
jgi:endonuclease/exonuclease/phosphatase family metal-dependent hydrolase